MISPRTALLRRFLSRFFDTGAGRGEELKSELACNCESTEPEDVRSGALKLMVARRIRGRRLPSFILVFRFNLDVSNLYDFGSRLDYPSLFRVRSGPML
jgi:hypothetical protein